MSGTPLPLHDLTLYLFKPTNSYRPLPGTFSDVHRCLYRDGSAFKKVAVKALRFSCALEGDKYGRSNKIRRELGIWLSLSHANIVPFLGVAYGFGMVGSMSLVSLWMQNGALQDFIAKHDNSLTTVHRLRFLLDISNGLQYLHSLSVAHGELNSKNVLVDENYTARLADFDYAFLVRDTSGILLGDLRTGLSALRWTAPEQYTIDADVNGTPESDVYLFGCVALQVMSGREPWSEVRHEVIIGLRMVEGLHPGRPSSRPMDDAHWDFLRHCWSPKEERPTAQAIVSIVQSFLSECTPAPPLRELLMSGPESLEARMTLFL